MIKEDKKKRNIRIFFMFVFVFILLFSSFGISGQYQEDNEIISFSIFELKPFVTWFDGLFRITGDSLAISETSNLSGNETNLTNPTNLIDDLNNSDNDTYINETNSSSTNNSNTDETIEDTKELSEEEITIKADGEHTIELNNPSPSGINEVSNSPLLNVTVTDPDSGEVNVSFYWYFEEFGLKRSFSKPAGGHINSVHVDDKYLYLGDYNYDEKGSVYVYYKENLSLKEELKEARGNEVNSIFSDEKYLYAADSDIDGYIQIYYKNNFSLKQELSPSRRVSVVYADDNYLYAGRTYDEDVKVYNKTDFSLKETLNHPSDYVSAIQGDNDYLYVGEEGYEGGSVYVYNKSNLSLKDELNHTRGDVSSLDVDNSYIYVGDYDYDGYSQIYYKNNFSLKQEISTGKRVYSLHSGKKYLYLGLDDGYIKIYYKNNFSLRETLLDSDYGFLSLDGDHRYLYAGDNEDAVYTYYKGSRLINSSSGVQGNDFVSYEWTGLNYGTNHDWYVNVTDGTNYTISEIWNFTTNFLPTVSSRDTYPNKADFTKNIKFNITCLDFDEQGDITAHLNVYNDSSFYDFTSKTVSNDTETMIYNLSYSNTAMGETWTGEYWCEDSHINGSRENDSVNINSLAPNQPLLNNPSPTGAEDIPTTPTLNVTVTDPEGDNMNVSFYNLEDDSQIGTTQTNITNGSYVNVTWSGLNLGTTYNWYANVTDGGIVTQSDIFNFTTTYNLTSCETITSSGRYELQNNLTNIDGDCFIINSEDVIIDGNGYMLIGDDDSSGEGFETIGNNNITITNFLEISRFYHNVELEDSDNSAILNSNIINGYSYGIYLDTCSNTTLINNTIGLTKSTTSDLYIIRGSNHLIYNNVFNSSRISFSVTGSHSWNNSVAGNLWTNPIGTGFSDTCNDSDSDGICDSSYDVYNDVSECNSDNCDYLPKASASGQSIQYTIDSCTSIYNPGVYTLTQNITGVDEDCIVIKTDNVTIDGNGYEMEGDDDSYGSGIYSNERDNIIIKNFRNIKDFETGIDIFDADLGLLIENNKLTSNYNNGIYIGSSNNFEIINNTANSNTYGIELSSSSNGIVFNNTANSNQYYGSVSVTPGVGLFISRGSNNLISDNDLKLNSDGGIYLYTSANSNEIVNNTIGPSIGRSERGIVFYHDGYSTPDSKYNLIHNNVFNNSENTYFESAGANPWNNSIGGNYWANPSGSGFSQLCNDTSPESGTCDSAYDVRNNVSGCSSGNCDYAPLAVLPSEYDRVSGGLGLYSCGEINESGTYILQNNITGIDGTCFNITADNVIINGKGYEIKGDGDSDGYGVYINGKNNSIIRNFRNISGFSHGIYLNNLENNTITNTKISSNNYGVFSNNTKNNLVSYSEITSNNIGFSSNYSLDNSIINNTISSNSIKGVGFYSSSNNLFVNNLFNQSSNIDLSSTESNLWNNSLRGNYYTNSSGNGFSDTCNDADDNSICDNSYTIGTNNVDYKPLSKWPYEYNVYECREIGHRGIYVLKSDITNGTKGIDGTCFNITADNVILDGNGYEIKGDGDPDGYGVYTKRNDNLVVRNFKKIYNFTNAIRFRSAPNNSIFNNTLQSNSSYPTAYLRASSNNTIYNNTILYKLNSSDDSFSGIEIDGNRIYNVRKNEFERSLYNVVKDNNISAHRVFLKDCSYNYVLNNNFHRGSVSLADTENNLIKNNKLSLGIWGGAIYLTGYGNYNRIINNTVSDPGECINFEGLNDNMHHNEMINNTLTDCGFAIRFWHTNNNEIAGNNMTNNNYGIYVESSSGNDIYNNHIYNSNNDGIILFGNNAAYQQGTSNNNDVYNNTIVGNHNGIRVTGYSSYIPSGNLIYNNFLNQSININFVQNIGTNDWNNSVIGNLWATPSGDGFSDICDDTAPEDGICDDPYVFNSDNSDYLPQAVDQGQAIPPRYFNVEDDSNSHGEVIQGKPVNVSVYWEDISSDIELAELYENSSGNMTMVSNCSFNSSSGWCNKTINTSGHTGKTICWKQYAKDVNGNSNKSMLNNTNCFDVLFYGVNPPYKPTLNNPEDGEEWVPLYAVLNVSVSDIDRDNMNVSFYNAEDNSQVGDTQTNISSGSYTYVNWTGLIEEKTYEWYANVTDGDHTTKSDIWNFTANINDPLSLSSVFLRSFSGNNYSSEDLFVSFSVSDPDKKTVYNTTDWRLNGSSIARLNMPFNLHYEENDSDGVEDFSTNNNHGYLGGGNKSYIPSWSSSCKVGGCYNFSDSDYIAINDSYDGTDYTEVTVASWIKTTDDNQIIISYDRNEYWRFGIGSSGDSNKVTWNVGTNDGQLDFSGNTTVNDGKWHHVVALYDNGLTKIYVDGDLDAQTTQGTSFGNTEESFAFISGSSEASVFGGSGGGSNFNGKIDELVVFDRALSDEQIKEMFNKQNNSQAMTELVSNETSLRDVWEVRAIASDEGFYSSSISNNLTIRNYTANNTPNKPILNSPKPSGVEGVSIPALLNVTVSDIDEDNMNVSFYDALDDSQIGLTQTNISDGGYAFVNWTGLNNDQNYEWYANVTDGIHTTKSDVWNFTTKGMVSNNPPIMDDVKDINKLGVEDGEVIRGENVTINATVNDTDGLKDIDKVWVKVWDGAVENSEVIFQDFMNNISGNLWSIIIETDYSYNTGEVNYTVYVNDSFGKEDNKSGELDIISNAILTSPDPFDAYRPREMEVSTSDAYDSIDNIVLRWERVEGADKYLIWYSENVTKMLNLEDNYESIESANVTIENTKKKEWVDENAGKHKERYYRIAVYSAENEELLFNNNTIGKFDIPIWASSGSVSDNDEGVFVSLPLIPFDNDLDNMIRDASGNSEALGWHDSIRTYRSTEEPLNIPKNKWLASDYYSGYGWYGDIDKLEVGKGYWFTRVKKDFNLTVVGKVPTTNLSVKIIDTLNINGETDSEGNTIGWNSPVRVCNLSSQLKGASGDLVPTENSWHDSIRTYNSTLENNNIPVNEWLTVEYIEGLGWYNSNEDESFECFEPGRGYFFTRVNKTYTWNQERDPRK